MLKSSTPIASPINTPSKEPLVIHTPIDKRPIENAVVLRSTEQNDGGDTKESMDGVDRLPDSNVTGSDNGILGETVDSVSKVSENTDSVNVEPGTYVSGENVTVDTSTMLADMESRLRGICSDDKESFHWQPTRRYVANYM